MQSETFSEEYLSKLEIKMKSLKQLREEQDGLRDRLDGIVALATKEERELTPEEQATVDRITDEELPKIEKAMATGLKLESERKAKGAVRMSQQLDEVMGTQSARVSPTMRDSRGNPVFCLTSDQRIVDTLDSRPVENGLGECIRAMVTGVNRWTPDQVQAALTSSSGTAGGFLVPDSLSANVIDLARAQSVVMRAGAMTIPMDTSSVSIAKVVSDPTIEVKVENEAFDEGSVTFGQVQLNAYTIGCMVTASRELAEDAPNFASLMEGVLSRALATKLDWFAIQGTGSAQPTGLVTTGDISETGSVGAIAWEDLAAAASKVRQNNHEPNAIVLGVESHEDLMVAVGGDGSSSTKTWLLRPPSLEGQNIFATNNCPLANAICGDFSKLVWGLRTSAMIEATTTGGDSFAKHQVKFKIVFRGDVGLTDASAFHRLAGITS